MFGWQRGDRVHVLVIDDDPVILVVTREWLMEAGYRVSARSAALGTAAEILALRPDVALIDVMMPGLRGDDLARLLKRHPATRGVAVILYSALEPDELRPMIMSTNALGVIQKTSDQAAFTLAFNSMVGRRRGSALGLRAGAGRLDPDTSGTHRLHDPPASDLQETEFEANANRKPR